MPRSTGRVNHHSTEPPRWYILAFGDCCYSEGLVKTRGGEGARVAQPGSTSKAGKDITSPGLPQASVPGLAGVT